MTETLDNFDVLVTPSAGGSGVRINVVGSRLDDALKTTARAMAMMPSDSDVSPIANNRLPNTKFN